MVSNISTVSSLASKHLCSLLLTTHTIPGQSALLLTTITLTVLTILGHTVGVAYLICCVFWVRTPLLPSGPMASWCAPQSHLRMMMAPTFLVFIPLVIIATKHNNATLAECDFFPFGNSVQVCHIVKQINAIFALPLPIVFLATIGLLDGHGGVLSLQNIEILTVYMSLSA